MPKRGRQGGLGKPFRFPKGRAARGRRVRRRVAPARFRNVRTGGFVGLELKFYDSSLVTAALTAPTDASGGVHDQSATIGPTTIPQGDGENERDGRKAVVKSVFVNGVINIAAQLNQTATDSNPIVYVALVKDMQTNGAILTSELVFKNDSGSAIAAASPMRNLQFSTRFRILDRKQFTLAQPTVVWDGTNIEQGGVMQPFVLSWKGDMPMTFKGTTETIANTVDNSIHVIAYVSSAAAGPSISYNCRTRFMG